MSKTNKQLGAYLNRLITNFSKLENNHEISYNKKNEKQKTNMESTYEVCEIIENKIKNGEAKIEDFNLNLGALESIDLEY